MIVRLRGARACALFTTFALVLTALSARSAGNSVEKFAVRGYFQAVELGADVVPGQVNPPVGSVEVSQTVAKGGKSDSGPGIFAYVGVAAFPTPTTAVEVLGSGEATGTVTPTNSGFSSPGSFDVSVPGIVIYYTYNPLLGVYEPTQTQAGIIRAQSTLQKPTEVTNARERSTHSSRLGGISLSTRSTFHGRFGYGASGTLAVSFQGTDGPLIQIVPAGTAILPDESRLGFTQSGTITSMH